MKLKNAMVFVIGLLFTAQACKKNDVDLSSNSLLEEAINNNKNGASEWQSHLNWQSVKSGTSVIEYSIIIDSTLVTANISGMVLVFKKNKDIIQALPYNDESIPGGINWTYQVTESSIIISQEAKNAVPKEDENAFMYVVLKETDLQILRSQGYTKEKLIDTPYEALQLLLKQIGR